MPDYTQQINTLLNKPQRSLASYGTGTQQDIPDWLKKQSEVGLGRPAEAAMFRLGIHGQAGNYQQTLRDLIKNEGSTGVSGGFTTQNQATATDAFTSQVGNLEFDIGRKSDQVKTGALREMMGIEQFNMNQAFQFQTASANREMQRTQMQLEALISNRDYQLRQDELDNVNWLDTAFGIVGMGINLATLL
jgi:hypothetical protein